MSIIETNSVFIIGAGASAIFGMPLGEGLIEDIASQISIEIKKTHSRDSYGRISSTKGMDYSAVIYGAQGHDEYNKNPIASAALLQTAGSKFKDFAAVSTLEAKLARLLPLLSNQTSDTIDDFIVENEDVAQLTKICISTIFLQKLYEAKQQHKPLKLRDLSQRNFEFNTKTDSYSERNWIHHFINLVRKAVRLKTVSSKNKVKVISFNYDNILEYVLDKQFTNTGYDYKDWSEYIEIIHPHGQCGVPPETLQNPAELACEWAKGIFVVNEADSSVSEKVKADRRLAKEWVASSRKIYALGFAFAGPNLKLLGLDFKRPPPFDRLISYCNYDGNIGLRRNLLRFEIDNKFSMVDVEETLKRKHVTVAVLEAPGERSRPMNCSDWFKLGYPGEPPS